MHRERLRLRVDVRAGPAGRRDAGRQPGVLPPHRDAVHQRDPVGAALQLEPDHGLAVRHRDRGPGLREPVPLRPAQGRVQALAGREGRLGEQERLRADPARRPHLERRQAPDLRRRRVHLRAGQVRVGPVPQPVGLDGEGRGGRRADGQVHLLRAPVPAVGQPPLQPVDRAQAPVGRPLGEGRRHRRQREAGRAGPRSASTPSPGTSSTSSTPTTTPPSGSSSRAASTCPTTSCPGSPPWSRAATRSRPTSPSRPTCGRPTPPGWC